MELEQTSAIPAVPAIRVFISCPGDLGPQRAIVAQTVESLNDDPEFAGKIRLVAYAYENMTPARVGMDAQDVVNSYMLRPEETQLFICMLWRRMGTPMERFINPATGAGYQSGTEYEFLTAYDASQRIGAPVILLYRSHAPAPPTPSVPEEAAERAVQVERVEGFFARFAPGGDLKGMVGSFVDDAELERIIRRDVVQTLRADLLPLLKRRARAQMGSTSGAPVFFGLPPLTSDFVARPEALDALRRALLGSRPSVGVVAAAALHGMGGLGKTTLARAACEDPTIRAAFPDGVLWATLGQQPDLARLQREWIHALGGDITTAFSRESAQAEIEGLLNGEPSRDKEAKRERRVMLLVVDDVWSASDASALLVNAPTCRALITTRDVGQAQGAALVHLDLMVRAECRETLRIASHESVSDPVILDTIAERLGRLPLALRIIGSLLSNGLTWEEIEAALNTGELREMHEGQRDLFRAMAASVRFLPEDERTRYHELVIFPDDEPLSEGSVARLWARTGNVSKFGAKRLLAELRNRSLIQQGDTLHDLQVDYLRAVTLEEQRRVLHSMLCDSYGLTDKGDIPFLPDEEDDGYKYRRLAWHAAQAHMPGVLKHLLTDATYLQRKLALLGVAATLNDLALSPDDENIAEISAVIQAGATVLERDSSELANQITGRAGAMAYLHHIPKQVTPWLRLLSQSLIPLDPAKVHILQSYIAEMPVRALSADGHLALSVPDDQVPRLVDTSTGQLLCVFGGKTRASADGRLVLEEVGNWDAQLRNPVEGNVVHVLNFPQDLRYSGPYEWALSANGKVAIAAADRGLAVWRAPAWVCILLTSRDGAWDCALSEDGQRALFACDDRTLRLWDTYESREIARWTHDTPLYYCALSADGQLAVARDGGRFHILELMGI